MAWDENNYETISYDEQDNPIYGGYSEEDEFDISKSSGGNYNYNDYNPNMYTGNVNIQDSYDDMPSFDTSKGLYDLYGNGGPTDRSSVFPTDPFSDPNVVSVQYGDDLSKPGIPSSYFDPTDQAKIDQSGNYGNPWGPGSTFPTMGGRPTGNVNTGTGFDVGGILSKIFGSDKNGGTTPTRPTGGGTIPTGPGGTVPGGGVPPTNPNTGGGGSGGSSINDILRLVMGMYGAREEGNSADEYTKEITKLLENNQKYLDPFGGQRGQYQDMLRGAGQRLEDLYRNPNSSPMYTAAMAEMQRRIPRQMSKNRFGMGVNRAMSQASPEIYSNALNDARKTFEGYQRPAGAYLNPQNDNALMAALLGATKQDNTNPMISAIGKYLEGNRAGGGTNVISDTAGGVKDIYDTLKGFYDDYMGSGNTGSA